MWENLSHHNKIHICLFVYSLILQISHETSTKSDTLFVNEMIKMNFTESMIVMQHKTKVAHHNQRTSTLLFANADGWEPNTFQFSKQINDKDEIILQ